MKIVDSKKSYNKYEDQQDLIEENLVDDLYDDVDTSEEKQDYEEHDDEEHDDDEQEHDDGDQDYEEHDQEDNNEDYDNEDIDSDLEIESLESEKVVKQQIIDEEVKEEVKSEILGGGDTHDFSSISVRANGVLLLLTSLFIIVMFSIISLQFCSRGEKLREQGNSNNYVMEVNKAKRGDIVSEKGTIFATTQEKYKAFMDMRHNQLSSNFFYANYKALADSMSNLFGGTTSHYVALLDKWYKTASGYQLITPKGRLMDYVELQRFKKFPIVCGRSSYYVKGSKGKPKINTEKKVYGGLAIEKQYVRINLLGSMAQRTLGRQESDFQNGYGLEKAFDKYLKGKDGLQMKRRISGVFWMPVESGDNVTPVDGANIVTTIDADIQDVAERSLRDVIDKNKALWGTAVVMEVKTGEIRAMANLGWTKDGRIVEDYNHAIGDNVEPGSTFKLLPLIALLDDAGMDINDQVDTKQGRDVINGIRVTDTHGYGVLSLEGVMEKSSNIGFARAIDNYYRKTPSKYIDAIYNTGLCDSIPFQLEGARMPYVKRPSAKSWNNADLVTMSYGYAIQVTAMRTLLLYNAIANNGKMISPILVKKVEKDGRTIEEYNTKVIKNQVCSNNTLKIVKRALEKVITDGTGEYVFRNENYIIAGKTGTSKQVAPNGRYEDEKGIYYLASFVGYFPANDPKYSCVVYVKTLKPHGIARSYYGASLAAPVFRDISHYIYSMATDWGADAKKYAADLERQFAVEREKDNVKRLTYKKSRAYRATSYEDKMYMEASVYVKRGSSEQLKDAISDLSIKEDKVKCGSIYGLDKVLSSSDKRIEHGIMPNVVGMGLNDAVKMLEKIGVVVEVSGKGTIRNQSIKAGESIKMGNVVKLRLSVN